MHSYFLLDVVFLHLGAYGAAVLYRKKDDDSLVILKEISLHDLSATERQMAMNEVSTAFNFLLYHPRVYHYLNVLLNKY